MVARLTRALKHASFQVLLAVPLLIAVVQGARWRP